MAGDDEFPPLLEPGLKHMSMAELKALVVDRFPLSKRRKPLWDNFATLVDHLSSNGLACEIWVDGSFLTEKIDPDDIDFVVDFQIGTLEQGSPVQLEIVEKLNDKEFRKREKLHSFVMFTAPAGHNFHPTSLKSHEQWQRDFGRSYVKKEPKGIAVVAVIP